MIAISAEDDIDDDLDFMVKSDLSLEIMVQFQVASLFIHRFVVWVRSRTEWFRDFERIEYDGF